MAIGKPMFVTDIFPDSNTVVLGEEEELSRPAMEVSRINWLKYDSVSPDTELVTKVRYKDPGHVSNIIVEGDKIKVSFHSKVKGIAPGQSAVVYEGDDVICGGIIRNSLFANHHFQ